MEMRHTKDNLESEDYTKREKIVKTLFLICSMFALGLEQELTGTTLKDLIILTNSNYEVMARAMVGSSVGYIILAVLGGPLVDRFGRYCDLMVALCLSVSALATLLTPYTPLFGVLWALFCIRGMCAGLQNIAGQTILIGIWKEKATGPLHVLHFGYGIGAIIVPLILNPFLAVLSPDSTNETSFIGQVLNITDQHIRMKHDNETISQYLKVSRIKTGYLIVAIIVASVATVFIFYQFCYRQITHVSIKTVRGKIKIKELTKFIDPKKCTGGNRLYSVQIMGLLFFYFFNTIGGEIIIKTFLRSYSIDKLNFSGDDGSILNTAFAISYTLSRLAGLITSRYIPVRILVVLESFGLLVTTVLLEIFARHSKQALWILSIFLGMFVSPLYPSGMGWGNFFINLTGTAIAFIVTSSAFGAMVYGWLLGYLYQNYGYEMFLHQTLVCGVMLFLCTILMAVVTHSSKGRYNKSNADLKEESDE
ncbi:sodium-dependent glucose transporter 1B-like [Mytilus edulis]|uniref:sodium-dependent glucose transporter 1B-like n=1 Tax=Mytilus edulis TaxID=6550 RepID=UPI0039F0DC4A